MHGKAGVLMSTKMRRLVVAVPVVSVLLLANFLLLGEWFDRAGVIAWAQAINAEYVTGTAITVITALLILLPSIAPKNAPKPRENFQCPVCDAELRPMGRYCPSCGSRI